jgi:hypothetical protein
LTKDLSGAEQIVMAVRLRLAVGLLGEKEHANWWPSLWFTSNATAFLSPIYGNCADAARYHGVAEAARRVHDSRIGVGLAFHLFRLPETLERRLHDAVVRQEATGKVVAISPKEDSETLPAELSAEVDTNAGPIRVGGISDLDRYDWPKLLASHYKSAFRTYQQTFPYFAEGL